MFLERKPNYQKTHWPVLCVQNEPSCWEKSSWWCERLRTGCTADLFCYAFPKVWRCWVWSSVGNTLTNNKNLIHFHWESVNNIMVNLTRWVRNQVLMRRALNQITVEGVTLYWCVAGVYSAGILVCFSVRSHQTGAWVPSTVPWQSGVHEAPGWRSSNDLKHRVSSVWGQSLRVSLRRPRLWGL